MLIRIHEFFNGILLLFMVLMGRGGNFAESAAALAEVGLLSQCF